MFEINADNNFTIKLSSINNIAKALLSCNNLRCVLFKDDKFYTSNDDFNKKIKAITISSLQSFSDFLRQNTDKLIDERAVSFTGKYGLNYIAFVPYKPNFSEAIIIGPYLTDNIDEHFINKALPSDVELQERAKLKHLYKTIPHFNSQKIYYSQKMIELVFTNANIDMIFDNSSLPVSIPNLNESIPEVNIDTKASIDLIHSELIFFDYLLQGNKEKVMQIYKNKIRTTFMTPISQDPLRDSKNRAIIFVGVISRKVIETGITSEKVLLHEKAYISLIERSQSLIELSQAMDVLIENAVQAISKYNNINHINVIAKVSNYISANLSENIKLSEVAEYVGLSPNYFSSLFKKEMHISFADYVNQMRIKESKYLLKTTDYSIAEIAAAVGYSNQNYFTTIFKKVCDITPKQFRLKNL